MSAARPASPAPEQLVGDEYAYIDSRLGLAFASSFGAFSNCTRKPPTRAYPMRLTTLSSSIPASDDRGRIERRTLEGRLVFHGQVHPDVATVTIRTPRDVRTLVPSEGFVLAVYDRPVPGRRGHRDRPFARRQGGHALALRRVTRGWAWRRT